MTKYICQCGCETTIEIKKGEKEPECCGKPMKKFNDKEKSKTIRCGCCG
ncbi:MAG: hypothetical protein ABIE43_02435 [Patescibacteria group bacterium]